MKTHLLLAALLLLFFPSKVAAQTDRGESIRPEVSASVSFGRSAIRQEDSVPVSIWIDSQGAADIENVELHIASPEFVSWHQGPTCEGDPLPDPVQLGFVPADSALHVNLCVRTGTELAVGSFNVLFAFRYEWIVEGRRSSSIVTVEKSLDASLFGSDDVAGVPIALAVFILPGLIFWLVIGLLKVPWRQNQAPLGNQMIYSVLASVAILIIVQWLGSVGGIIGMIDAGGGRVSMEKLRNLALIGLTAGIVIGGLDHLGRWIRSYFRKKEEAYLIHPDDEWTLLLEKVLATYSDEYAGVSRVALKGGEVITGSFAKRESAFTAVIAWFQIDLEQVPDDLATRLRELERTGHFRELLQAARSGRVDIAYRDTLKTSSGEPLKEADLYIRVERTKNVNSVQHVPPDPGHQIEKPIVLL